MKKFIFTIFFVLWVFNSSLATGAQDLKSICRKEIENPKVTIETHFGNIQYNHTKSRRAISRIHLNNGGTMTAGKLLNGLSVFEQKVSVNVNIKHKKLDSGINCYYPSEINFTIGVGEDPIIYIAKEIKKDTCEYNVTLRHEQTHQQINQSVMEYYLPIIQERLLKTVKKYSVAATKKNIKIEQVAEELNKKYMKETSNIIEEIKKETITEQLKLDSPEHYAYDESLCD